MAKQTSIKHRSEGQTKSSRAEGGPTSGASPSLSPSSKSDTDEEDGSSNDSPLEETYKDDDEGTGDLMDSEAYTGPSEKVVNPLTPEALAAFNAVQARTGVTYISRIPPGMQPAKVRHLMSQYGEVGRVYLQQEGGLYLVLMSGMFAE
jgi:ESF2/ABP1 family protein